MHTQRAAAAPALQGSSVLLLRQLFSACYWTAGILETAGWWVGFFLILHPDAWLLCRNKSRVEWPGSIIAKICSDTTIVISGGITKAKGGSGSCWMHRHAVGKASAFPLPGKALGLPAFKMPPALFLRLPKRISGCSIYGLTFMAWGEMSLRPGAPPEISIHSWRGGENPAAGCMQSSRQRVYF